MKLCINCMAKMRDEKETCPYCGWQQNKGVRDSLHLVPGSLLSEGRYMVGRVKAHDKCRVIYIGWDYQEKTAVTILEYAPVSLAVRELGNPLMNILQSGQEDLFGEGLGKFLETAEMIQGGIQSGINRWNLQAYFVENGTGYIVHELLDGQSVAELLNQGHTFDIDSATNIIQDVAETLTVLHEAGLHHLAVRPDTILMLPDGSFKLAFPEPEAGIILKRLDNMQDVYGAEELYRDMGMIDPSADVYSLAATMYEMITGVKIPMAQNRLLGDQLVEPAEYKCGISSSQQNALMNALQVRKTDRTQSVAQFLEELHSGRTQRRNGRQTKSVSKRVRSSRGRNLLIATGVIVAVAIVAFVLHFVSGEKLDNTFHLSGTPYVEGQTLQEATRLAQKAGLTVEIKEYLAKDNARDEVLEQMPKAHENSEDGVIYLTLSGGNEIVTVPDVTGLPSGEAETKLKDCNLTVTDIKAVFDDTVEKGRVIGVSTIKRMNDEQNSESKKKMTEEVIASESDLPDNRLINQGTDIKLYVSRGSYSAVPSFTAGEIEQVILNKSLEKGADEDLQNLVKERWDQDSLFEERVSDTAVPPTICFTMEEDSQVYNDTVSQGCIVSLADGSGDVFRPVDEEGNSTILGVVVSKGPQFYQIPNVVGLSRSEAVKKLQSAGFRTADASSVYNSNYAAGTVCAQSGSGMARKNATVTITVSLGRKNVEEQKATETTGESQSDDGPKPGGEDIIE